MRIIGLGHLEAFQKKHPQYAKAIDVWVTVVEAAEWTKPQDVKANFGKRVDFVGKQTVFDAHANKVRIITKIAYVVKVISVTHALDHAAYDKKKWRE